MRTMTKRYNCPHEKDLCGKACAGCLAEAYDLAERLQKALRLLLEDAGQVGDPSTWRPACQEAHRVLHESRQS